MSFLLLFSFEVCMNFEWVIVFMVYYCGNHVDVIQFFFPFQSNLNLFLPLSHSKRDTIIHNAKAVRCCLLTLESNRNPFILLCVAIIISFLIRCSMFCFVFFFCYMCAINNISVL